MNYITKIIFFNTKSATKKKLSATFEKFNLSMTKVVFFLPFIQRITEFLINFSFWKIFSNKNFLKKSKNSMIEVTFRNNKCKFHVKLLSINWLISVWLSFGQVTVREHWEETMFLFLNGLCFFNYDWESHTVRRESLFKANCNFS